MKMKPGRRNLITDIEGLLVGNASDAQLKSGSTVLLPNVPITASVNVMGGAPGSRETDLLAPDKLVDRVDAIVLSGGSALGLDAASAVANCLRKDNRGYEVQDQRVPIVPGAILFDLLNGGDKGWGNNPYTKLGQKAYAAAAVEFGLGSVGAGAGATTANLKGGLGSASAILDNGITVGALVAVNAFGSVTPHETARFWAAPWEANPAEFGGLGLPDTNQFNAPILQMKELSPVQNTTIAIVATDAVMDKAQCQRMAVAAQDGMARAIVPSHTLFDGDLIFAASTGIRPLQDPFMDSVAIGHAAAIVLARAIARGVWEATTEPRDLLPTFKEKFAL